VHHLIAELSDGSLERFKYSLEGRIIAGTASSYDIDTYVQTQLELAAREFGRPALVDGDGAAASVEPHPDPRD
jgi:hypothetical protein